MRLIVNNEDLDIDKNQIVTFKRTQKLNGLQESYSFTNNFKLDKSSNNLRILNSNYLPTTKSKNMAQSIDCDVVFNDTIYLKKQQLKIKKDSESFDTYIVFSDSFLLTKTKELLMKDIDFGTTHDKTIVNLYNYNSGAGNWSTAPISAQDESGLIVIQEYNVLINIKFALETIFKKLGYTLFGDYLLDTYFPLYYFSSDVGWYGADGTAQFSDSLTAFDFIESVLETFNGYIDILDSTRYASFNLWKNIETLKDNFIDYSEYFDKEKDYISEESLAKKNFVKYSEGSDFYNSFFSNNKSLVKEKNYLTSDFGSGNMRLFSDQEIKEDGTIPLREVGEITDAKKLNLYKFQPTFLKTKVYDNGVSSFINLIPAVSPNMQEIWELFHKPYTDNISSPVIANLEFKYNFLFINDFKMQEVFFIKQLSSYWLPLEINFSTKKDSISIKAILIQKTIIDAPIVYDLNLSIGFYGEVYVVDQSLLYASTNRSPASSITIHNADLTKNFIFINTIEILSLPVTIDVSTQFEIRIVNKENTNNVNNSNIVFSYTSVAGGVSRLANINVAHNGSATYVSEFRSDAGVEYEYKTTTLERVKKARLNYSQKITNVLNIPTTTAPQIGFIDSPTNNLPSPSIFKILEFQTTGWVSAVLNIGSVYLDIKKRDSVYGIARASFNINIWKDGVLFQTLYSDSISTTNDRSSNVFYKTINGLVAGIDFYTTGNGQEIYIEVEALFSGLVLGGATGKIKLKDINWKFTKTE